jgi:hypothetical protein|tara:strand:- start:1521 stop:2099 length:579 start_codon:yes stop_codon:yes gene_type:complete
MSNQNAPFGLKPSSKLGSNYNSEGVTEYKIASGASGNIFSGDLVKMANTGTILVAAAGDQALGVFRGCQFTDSSGDVIFSPYWPNGTVTSDAVAFVVDDPNALFEVQSAATGSVVQTVVGNNADIVYTSGSTITGISAVEISGTTAATSAQLRIVGVSTDPENSTLGTGSASTNVNLIVKINEHFYAQTTGV